MVPVAALALSLALSGAPAGAADSCADAVARCEALQHEPEQALACAQQLAARYPNCPQAQAIAGQLGMVMAYAAKELGDGAKADPIFKMAFEAFTKSAAADPRNAEKVINRAHMAYESGNYDEAFKSYTQALSVTKDKQHLASAYAGRGCVLGHEGKFDQALREMDMAWKSSPDHTVLISRAELYTRMGDKAKAMADYQRALDMIKDPPEYRSWVQKELDKVRASSGERQPLRPLGGKRPGPGAKPTAAPAPSRAPAPARPEQPARAAAAPECVRAVKECYSIHKAGKLRDALTCSSKVVKTHASCAPARFQRGWLWGNMAEEDYRKKRSKEARAAWQQAKDEYAAAVNLDPADALAMINRGMAEYKLGQFQPAVDSLTKGLSLARKPDAVATAQFDRAVAYAALGEHQKALADFEAAYGFFKKPWVERAQSWAANGDADKARQEYERVIREEKDSFVVERARAGLDALKSAE